MQRTYKTELYNQRCWNPTQLPRWGEKEPDFFLSGCGRFYGSGRFRMDYRSSYCFCYIILEGKTTITLDGREYTLVQGDLLFVFAHQQKTLQESSSLPIENWYLDISGSAHEQVLNGLGVRRGHQHFPGRFDQLLQPLCEELTHVWRNEVNEDPFNSLTIAWRMIELLRPHLPAGRSNTDIVESARLLLMKEFRHNLGIQELSDKLGCSRSTLFRRFRERFGCSPKQYQEQLRLEEAHRLLSSTNLPAGEVAILCGYESPQHFSRAFRRRFGQSPRSLR